MNTQLAIAFQKNPAAMVDTLLEWWAQYLESHRYLQEKTRAQKTDAEAVNEKDRQVQLKMKVQRLRASFGKPKHCTATRLQSRQTTSSCIRNGLQANYLKK